MRLWPARTRPAPPPAILPTRTVDGVFYFDTPGPAALYAEWTGAPTRLIQQLEQGWAIQWHACGPFVGPDALTHTGCDWCNRPKGG